MKSVLKLSMLAAVLFSMSPSFAEVRSEKNTCDPLFGCPIDPGKCVRDPVSCGVHKTNSDPIRGLFHDSIQNSASEAEDWATQSPFVDGLDGIGGR